MNRSYFDLIGDTVAPEAGKSLFGILKIFWGTSLSSPIHNAKSKSLELRLNTHQPDENFTGRPRFIFRLYNSQIFRSIRSPFHQKSNGVLSANDGLTAPYLLMNHSSQSTPFCGLPKYILSLGGLFLSLQAILIQVGEQYFGRVVGLLHCRHNIVDTFLMYGA